MTPFDCYKTYIAMKTHFTKNAYDYILYNNKRIRASTGAFYGKGNPGDKDYKKGRKDRMFFERMSRKYSDKEIERFFVSNFANDVDSQQEWMSNIVKYGEKNYIEWQKKIGSLSYTFKEESMKLFENKKIDDLFKCSKGGHPPILKSFMRKEISLETLVIYDKILQYRVEFDKKMTDPVWESFSMKIKKYSPFINIDVFHYKKILKDIVVDSAG